MTIVEFLTARLDEDEAIARSAMQDDRLGQWEWVRAEDDMVITPDPFRDEHLSDGDTVGLRSVGHPRRVAYADWALPVFVLPGIQEVPSVSALHIARHDPARVLADVAAKRDVIEQLEGAEHRINGEWGCGSLKESDWVPIFARMAAVYSDHPDYLAEWRL